MTRILATINPHEQEAMRKLVQVAHVFSKQIAGTQQSKEVRVCANILQGVLDRIEQKEPAQ